MRTYRIAKQVAGRHDRRPRPSADALLARIKEQGRARGCASTSAPRPASARPTRCCRRRTRCAPAASTWSSASSRPTAAATPRRSSRISRSFPGGRSSTAARRWRRWTSTRSSRRKPAGVPSSTSWRTPTCRAAGNAKRYEDVLELLDAGIHVMTAVNIQHLETLNDAVARATGVRVRETVPDTFLDRADEVINVDVTVEELRNRLREGKDLPAGEGRAGADQLLPQRQSVDASRAGAARRGRRGRREGGQLSRARRAGAGADSRAGDGVHELECAGAESHQDRRAHRRPARVEMVCRLR